MYYEAQILSVTGLLITIVILANGKHLQGNERRNVVANEKGKTFERMFGHSLEYIEFVRLAYDNADSFAKQQDRLYRHLNGTDENSTLLRARMIPYDFSQEPVEPYVYEVTSETSQGTTLGSTTSAQTSKKQMSTKTPLITPTTISTDAPQTSTAASTLPVTTISFPTTLLNNTQTPLLTTTAKSHTVTSLPSTRVSLLSTILHFKSTTASLEKSTSISPTSLSPNISSTMTSTLATTNSQAGTLLPSTGISSFTTVPHFTNTTESPEKSVSRNSTSARSTTKPTPASIITPTHECKPSTFDPTTVNTTFASYTTHSKL